MDYLPKSYDASWLIRPETAISVFVKKRNSGGISYSLWSSLFFSLFVRLSETNIEITERFSEKAVVYNFMDTLSKSANPAPARPVAPKPEDKRGVKPQFSKELYFQQRAKSARSQRVTERPSLPPRPKSVGSMR